MDLTKKVITICPAEYALLNFVPAEGSLGHPFYRI
jgi:hypothetical protein